MFRGDRLSNVQNEDSAASVHPIARRVHYADALKNAETICSALPR
ncbi:hypothetical protein RE6C_03377 [Rhodopirellula europaea 6C]|uniref:Uncharacterized protein n=1 Tax=Rhodopirellula europaea 6C TaxID=1263867 RepID=M2AFI7_9BACT|nr:hypothetical protein RE6C_03377 [Rhodopirellula europaea 6C]